MMNCYEYKIYDSVYNDIISGKKTIEFRLLNDKTKRIQKGDQIKFKVLNNENKFVLVEVLDKYIYENIEDLLNSDDILENTLNYDKEEFYKVFYNIFGKEIVEKSKIVGIKFRLI